MDIRGAEKRREAPTRMLFPPKLSGFGADEIIAWVSVGFTAKRLQDLAQGFWVQIVHRFTLKGCQIEAGKPRKIGCF
jgi:hypothetical protein